MNMQNMGVYSQPVKPKKLAHYQVPLQGYPQLSQQTYTPAPIETTPISPIETIPPQPPDYTPPAPSYTPPAGKGDIGAPGGTPPLDYGDPSTWGKGSPWQGWMKDLGWEPQQEWYRSAGWPGHIVYNPTLGWQDYPTVTEAYKNIYEQYGEAPGRRLFEKEMLAQGLTHQLDPNLREYYPDRPMVIFKNGVAIGYEHPDGRIEYFSGYEPGTDEPGTYEPGTYEPGEGEPAYPPGEWPEEWGPLGPYGYEDPRFLERFGYQGGMDFNPWELAALDFAKQIWQERAPYETLAPAEDFYGDLLGGAFAPAGQKFRGEVYEPAREEMFSNLERAQRMMGERFSNVGAFYGGHHDLQQALLAKEMMSPINQILAELNLEGYKEDIGSRLAGAQGLTGMAGTEQAISSDILGNLMGGGQMVTQRGMTNQALIFDAAQRAYQDWSRGRQETMMPFNMILALLGKQAIQPIAYENQASPWGALLGALGMGAGSLLGGFGSELGGGLGSTLAGKI